MATEAMEATSGVSGRDASPPDSVVPQAAHANVQAPPLLAPGGAPLDPSPAEAVLRDRRASVAVQAWRRMRREPSLMFTTAYLLVSCIGLWANYWFYRAFDLPILEYMQATDYLVAGLRDPVYALVLLLAVGGVFLVSWPDVWRRSHPARVEQLRRHWWGRVVFPNVDLMRWKALRMTPETGIVLAAMWGTAWCTAAYVLDKAQRIRDGGAGRPLEVTLAGNDAPRPGQARLLGTSGAFVFLWWPVEQRAEAVPIESIGRMQVRVPRKVPQVPRPKATASPRAGGTR